MYINRLIKKDIQQKLSLKQSKIIVIYGARQVGKTSLVEEILSKSRKKVLKLSGDELKTASLFSSRDLKKMKNTVSGYDILFIDEAQKIENVGLNLKILYDSKSDLKIIVTGSSSFELAHSIHEPLTGRAWIYHLHPIALCELKKHWTPHEFNKNLEDCLIFGSYPEVFSIKQISDREEYLHSLSRDYLYKDVLEVEGIRSSQKIKKLLQLLAFQIGSEVSLTELSNRLEINKKTVERYIDLLEKFFVIFALTGFSRNLRKEISQKPKIYFYDLGIRNSLINNFNLMEDRNDIGTLWENFVIAERLKYNNYYKNFASAYFWRTYTGAELDYVEEDKGKLNGYEVKWQKKSKAPKTWLENYKASFQSINKDNYLDFLT